MSKFEKVQGMFCRVVPSGRKGDAKKKEEPSSRINEMGGLQIEAASGKATIKQEKER